MKIGIDARFFGPESKGLGRYTQKLIEHLENIDQENDYVIFLMSDNYDLYTPKNARFTKVIADYRWYTWHEQIFFPRVLAREKCDFIHFPHFNVPLLYRKPFLVTIHDLILLRFPTHEASTRSRLIYGVKFLMYRVVIAHAVRAAKHIIAVSEFTKRDIITHYHVRDDRVSVTHEAGPEVVEVNQDPDIQLQELRTLDIIGKYLLYVGNAYPHKNLNTLIEAFALWQEKDGSRDDMQLVLVGRDDYFYRRLHVFIEEKALQHIIIVHTVSDDVLATLYHNAHAFVFPSLYEGFGLPPLEACAYGTPVLSSRKSCMPEILEDAVLYTDVDDCAVFAKDIDRIISDQELRRELHQKGPEQAQKYAWHKTVDKTHAIYKDVV